MGSSCPCCYSGPVTHDTDSGGSTPKSDRHPPLQIVFMGNSNFRSALFKKFMQSPPAVELLNEEKLVYLSDTEYSLDLGISHEFGGPMIFRILDVPDEKVPGDDVHFLTRVYFLIYDITNYDHFKV